MTNVRENCMEERASLHYMPHNKPATCGDVRHTTALLRRDCDQSEIRIRQTCMRSVICLLGIACASCGTLAVLLATGFGFLDF